MFSVGPTFNLSGNPTLPITALWPGAGGSPARAFWLSWVKRSVPYGGGAPLQVLSSKWGWGGWGRDEERECKREAHQAGGDNGLHMRHFKLTHINKHSELLWLGKLLRNIFLKMTLIYLICNNLLNYCARRWLPIANSEQVVQGRIQDKLIKYWFRVKRNVFAFLGNENKAQWSWVTSE